MYLININYINSKNIMATANKVSLNNVRVEYPLRDVYKKLQGQTVKIQLWTEIMPHVGIIYRVYIIHFNNIFLNL
jgi:hypothetical protein